MLLLDRLKEMLRNSQRDEDRQTLVLLDWQSRLLGVLTSAGLSQSEAIVEFHEQYGKGSSIDTSKCPKCAAEQLLLRRGMIPVARR